MQIMDEFETLAWAQTKSIARFGDGELRLCLKGSASAQKHSPRLALELRKILAEPSNALVCIPRTTKEMPRYKSWQDYWRQKYSELYKLEEYGSAFITRPDNTPWIDTQPYWEMMRALWRDKDVTLVAGSERSLTPDTLTSARSVRHVEVPYRDAYDQIDLVEQRVGEPKGVVILCAGPMATCLAVRLANKGVHALDLGHVGMFMRRMGVPT
jgi:hypothetical protein